VNKSFFLAGVFILVFGLTSSYATYPQVTLHITGGVTGDIVIELYPDKAPITVTNFINYVNAQFYDNLIFHRVVKGFVIQGGGFDQNLNQKTTGLGSAIINESSHSSISNLRGTIAMARQTGADTATSQFFINVVDNNGIGTNNLNYGCPVYNQDYYPPVVIGAGVGYCAFGKVISGMTVVDAIAAVQVNSSSVPLTPVIMQTARVTLNGGVCTTFLAGDANKDCKVDFKDFALIASTWLQCNSILPTCN
jgi:cyclophilin family peptidyl-prolyl cis-trans isomerase